jgi:hypothetical protein
VASLGLWLSLDAGQFERVEINTRTGVVRLGLAPATPTVATALLRVEQPARINGVGTYHPAPALLSERDAFRIPLKQGTTWVELTETK